MPLYNQPLQEEVKPKKASMGAAQMAERAADAAGISLGGFLAGLGILLWAVLQNASSDLGNELITILITASMATLGFSGIMKALSPIIEVIYPLLIIYIIFNSACRLWKLNTHQPVSLTMTPESSDWKS